LLERRPGLAKRAAMAWQILRGSRQRKAAPFAWPTWRQGKPQWQLIDYETYVNEGFNLNALIYEAIMYKARSMSTAPLRAYKGDLDNPEPLEPEHELANLGARPNPHQSWDEFQRQNTTYLNISGNCYIFKDGGKDGLPEALYSFRPDRTYIVPAKGKRAAIEGYLYQPEGTPRTQWIEILPEQMMHIKFPNPGDPLEGMGYGLSPISPMARSANVDNDVTHFLKLFCDKGAALMGILEYPPDIMIDEAETARIKERWTEMYGGYEKWATEVGVLDQGGKFRRLMPPFADLGFETIDERNEARILGPFGVPLELIPTKLGQKHSTFTNRKEARRAFWEDTMVPETQLFEVELRYHLQGAGGEFVGYDFSKVPALRRDIKEQIVGAFKMWQLGTPRDIAYQVVGLDVERTDGGDESYLPINILPAGGAVPQLPAGGGASVEEEERKERVPSEEWKERMWERYNRIAIVWERPFRNQVKELFKQDKKALSVRITWAEKKAIEDKATIDWQSLRNSWLDYIDASRKDWAIGMQPLMEGVAREQATQLDATFGGMKQAEIVIDWDIVPVEALEWVGGYTMHFADGVASVTKGSMEGLLNQAVEEGWSARKLRTNMGKVFQQWTDGDLTPAQFEWFAERMPKHRLDMIARTETIRASNKGAQERYRSWGVPYNEWYTAKDDRTCDFCLELHGTVYGVDETLYRVGEQMNVEVERDGEKKILTLKFGYEDVTCPPLHPRCRCVLLPRMEMVEAQE